MLHESLIAKRDEARRLGAGMQNKEHVSVSQLIERGLIDAQDDYSGLPPGGADDLSRSFEQRGVNQTGLGFRLTIAKRVRV